MNVDEFDRLIEELQQQIGEQERALYSAGVIEHAHNPRNMRRMVGAHAFAAIRGWCGDTMEFYLRLTAGGRIAEVTFMTDGCGPTVACGSMLASLVRGLSPEKALLISAQDLISALKGLPEESVHCAELAVNTLQAAISNWKSRDSC